MRNNIIKKANFFWLKQKDNKLKNLVNKGINETQKRLRMIHKIAITITKCNTFINFSQTKYKFTTLQPRNKKIKNIERGSSRTLTYTSGGLCGFRGTHKASPMANFTMGELAAIKFKKFGLRHIHIHLFGAGKRMRETIKGLLQYGLAIDRIEHKIKIPHNGTRRKKRRRK